MSNPRLCKHCKKGIPWDKTKVLRLRRPKKRFADTGIGFARACPFCRTIQWNNGQQVVYVIVDGKELTGPVYLANDGVTITNNPNGVAAKS